MQQWKWWQLRLQQSSNSKKVFTFIFWRQGESINWHSAVVKCMGAVWWNWLAAMDWWQQSCNKNRDSISISRVSGSDGSCKIEYVWNDRQQQHEHSDEGLLQCNGRHCYSKQAGDKIKERVINQWQWQWQSMVEGAWELAQYNKQWPPPHQKL